MERQIAFYLLRRRTPAPTSPPCSPPSPVGSRLHLRARCLHAVGHGRGQRLSRRRPPSGILRVPEAPEYENHPFTIQLARDGRTFEVPEDKSAAEILQSAGFKIDIKCSDGICGVCKCGVVEGEVEHRDFVLSKAQRKTRSSRANPAPARRAAPWFSTFKPCEQGTDFMPEQVITGYHAHVYFDADTVERPAPCARRRGIGLGWLWGGCTSARWPTSDVFLPACSHVEQFGVAVAVAGPNRDGLIVFAHPETGDDLAITAITAYGWARGCARSQYLLTTRAIPPDKARPEHPIAG